MVEGAGEGIEDAREAVDVGEGFFADFDFALFDDGDDPALGAAGDGAGDIRERGEFDASGDEKSFDRGKSLFYAVNNFFQPFYFFRDYGFRSPCELGLNYKKILLNAIDGRGDGNFIIRQI